PYPFTPSPAFAHSSTHIWTGCDLVPLDPAIFSASGSRGGIIYIRGRIGFRYSAPLPFSAETSLAVETISSITAGYSDAESCSPNLRYPRSRVATRARHDLVEPRSHWRVDASRSR